MSGPFPHRRVTGRTALRLNLHEELVRIGTAGLPALEQIGQIQVKARPAGDRRGTAPSGARSWRDTVFGCSSTWAAIARCVHPSLWRRWMVVWRSSRGVGATGEDSGRSSSRSNGRSVRLDSTAVPDTAVPDTAWSIARWYPSQTVIKASLIFLSRCQRSAICWACGAPRHAASLYDTARSRLRWVISG